MNKLTIIQNIASQLDNLSQEKSIKADNDIDAIKIWLNEFINSPNTFVSYKQTAERFIMWAIEHQQNLSSITREDIQDYQDFLANPSPKSYWCGPAVARGNPEWKPFVKGLAPSSIKLNLQILTTMYEYLIQSGYLSINPFRLIKRKSARLETINKNIERYLTHKEWDYIIQQINKMPQNTAHAKARYKRTKWIFNLLYYTGCRRSEICNGLMSDFIYKNGKWWLAVIGKGNKYGEIPVTPDLLSALIEYRQHLGLSDFPNRSETHIALVNSIKLSNGRLTGISDSMLYKTIKDTCRNIADSLQHTDPSASYVIKRVSTHWMRHTSATHQVDAGIDIRIVKENLRHSLLETTMRYQHTEDNIRHSETINKFGNSKK